MLTSHNTYNRSRAGRDEFDACVGSHAPDDAGASSRRRPSAGDGENAPSRRGASAFGGGRRFPREFQVSAAGLRFRWELIFIGAVVLALALIFLIGIFVADAKVRAAQDRSIAIAQQVDAAASNAAQQEQEAAAQAQAEAEAEAARKSSAPLPADRDQRLALNPDWTEWSTDDNNRKVVYLTIDDGPSALTPQVLDVLDRYNAKATFFVVGHNEDCFPLIKEAYDRGHTIGLHSASHDYDAVYSSPEAYFADLEAIGAIVRDQIGYVPCFIRFPGGSSNSVGESINEGIMDILKDEVVARGYQFIDWNRSVGDGSEHTTDEIIEYACEPIDEENIVILCHDSATKQTTLDALPAIIEHYQGLGYSFEALDRDSWICHHS